MPCTVKGQGFHALRGGRAEGLMPCGAYGRGKKFFINLTKTRKKLWYNVGMERLYAKRRLSRPQKLGIAALVCAVIFLTARIPAAAEYFYARGITRALGFILAKISGAVPISFYEIAVFLLIFVSVWLLGGAVYLLCKKCYRRLVSLLYRVLMAVLCVLAMFGVMYAPLYDRVACYGALGLQVGGEVAKEDVEGAAEFFVRELNLLAASVGRDAEGNVCAPYTFGETADLLNGQFAKYGDYFAFYEVRPKKVVFSVGMSYLGITGIYIPFWAEANVNTDIPPYVLPVTMAHEMTHAKGVSQENQANAAAYALCIRAEDEYLRYCGFMSGTAVLLNALDEAEYERLYGELCDEVKREYRNASEHYAKYEGFLDTLSAFFNDLFLKANGVPDGTRSYGRTTAVLVSLYKELSA